MRKHLATACLALLTAAAPAGAQQDLPLGDPLDQSVTEIDVGPGVQRYSYVVGERERRPGPWRVHVLRIAPGTQANALLANGAIAGVERPSAFGRRALAGVNGAYVVTTGPGVGDLVGLHVSDGELASEPVDGRSVLLLPADPLARPRVTATDFSGRVTIGGRSRALDGINRVRGQIWGCGGRGGDRPTERPLHGIPCSDPSELVQLTSSFGARTPGIPGGAEAVVRDGVIESVRPGGGTPIPDDGFVLSGSGDAATFLRRAGGPVEVTTALRTAGGAPLLLSDVAGAVSGGPRLVDRGRIAVRSKAEGFSRPGLYGRFVLSRHPRTLAGVTATGELLLVVIDGRRPGHSAGATLLEAARVMRALGAREALNLDGGGSSAMVVRGRVVNRPSDPGGERAVGDGVFVPR